MRFGVYPPSRVQIPPPPLHPEAPCPWRGASVVLGARGSAEGVPGRGAGGRFPSSAMVRLMDFASRRRSCNVVLATPTGKKKPGTPSTRSLTDRASDYGSEGCRFESCRVHSRPEAPEKSGASGVSGVGGSEGRVPRQPWPAPEARRGDACRSRRLVGPWQKSVEVRRGRHRCRDGSQDCSWVCAAGADRSPLGHQQGLIVGWATDWLPGHPRTESGMQLHFRAGHLAAGHAAPTLTVPTDTDTRADASAFGARSVPSSWIG